MSESDVYKRQIHDPRAERGKLSQSHLNGRLGHNLTTTTDYKNAYYL